MIFDLKSLPLYKETVEFKSCVDGDTAIFIIDEENSKADEYWTNYQAALSAGDEDMAQWWKEQWDAETEALDEA